MQWIVSEGKLFPIRVPGKLKKVLLMALLGQELRAGSFSRPSPD